MREIAIGLVQNKFANKRVLDKQNRHEAQRQKEATRIRNKRTAHEIKQDLKQEAKEAEFREGVNIFHRSKTAGGAAESLRKLDAEKAERNRLNAIETKRRNDIDERWQQYLDSGNPEHFVGSDGKATNLKKTSNMSDKKLRELYSERQKRLLKQGILLRISNQVRTKLNARRMLKISVVMILIHVGKSILPKAEKNHLLILLVVYMIIQMMVKKIVQSCMMSVKNGYGQLNLT